jgi:outer membrane protein assembly factor BamB
MMLVRCRRVFAAVLLTGAWCVILPVGLAQDKPAVPRLPGAKDTLPFSQSALLPTDTLLPKKFEAVRDYARTKSWEEVARLLQAVLDAPEDVFLPITTTGPDGKETMRLVGARAEADREIMALPPAGRAGYEATFGREAQRLAEVVRRFAHTRAGAETAIRLAAQHLDRGRFHLSAAYFDLSMRSINAEAPAALTLFQAAVAHRAAGQGERAEALWKRLAEEHPDGLTLAEKKVSLAELEKSLTHVSATEPIALPALSEPKLAWRSETIQDGILRSSLEDAVRTQEKVGMVSGSLPLIVGERAVFRTHQGVTAVDLRTGRPSWVSLPLAGLDSIGAEKNACGTMGEWLDAYRSANASALLLENSVVGTLTSDQTRIYAVDDLPVPAYPQPYFSLLGRQGEGIVVPNSPSMTDAIYHSRLLAFSAKTGKLLWDRGGRASAQGGDRDPVLRDAYFLGPPLALDGKLYTAVQKDFDLFLVCLQPTTGAVVWYQRLAAFKSRMVLDGGRRVHAVPLVESDGMLVCQTNAGGVVAFDLAAHRLAWAHVYREEPPPPPPPAGGFGGRRPGRFSPISNIPPNLTSEWKSSPPVVAGERILLTPPDSNELHCLSLRDGSLLWKAKREDDLYLAGVFGEKIVLVGRENLRALSLTDGTQVWKCFAPTTVGRAARTGDALYLPIRTDGGKNQLLAIDVEKGEVRSRIALSEQDAGNLVLTRGILLSQSPASVTSYKLQIPGDK